MPSILFLENHHSYYYWYYMIVQMEHHLSMARIYDDPGGIYTYLASCRCAIAAMFLH